MQPEESHYEGEANLIKDGTKLATHFDTGSGWTRSESTIINQC